METEEAGRDLRDPVEAGGTSHGGRRVRLENREQPLSTDPQFTPYGVSAKAADPIPAATGDQWMLDWRPEEKAEAQTGRHQTPKDGLARRES